MPLKRGASFHYHTAWELFQVHHFRCILNECTATASYWPVFTAIQAAAAGPERSKTFAATKTYGVNTADIKDGCLERNETHRSGLKLSKRVPERSGLSRFPLTKGGGSTGSAAVKIASQG